MKLSKELAQLVAKLAKASEKVVKSGKMYDWPMLLSILSGLVLENSSALSKIKKELEIMDESEKTEFVSQVEALFSQGDKSGFLTLLILELIIIGIDSYINSLYTQNNEDISLKNPPEDYWFRRVDTKGDHRFNKDGIYLINTIPAANKSHYYNSEIYNSPYTSIQPKNVIINSFPLENPQKEPKKFIYDLLLNIPYTPSNGLVFSSRAKAKNLKGGSRGWGFWNTNLLPISMEIAWFVQYEGNKDGQHSITPNGFYAQTIKGVSKSSFQLPDLDENWHDYRIELNKESVEYFIDGKSVHKETDPGIIPESPMAFHNWVDNAVFGMNKDSVPCHILQETTAPRINYMEYLSIHSKPDK